MAELITKDKLKAEKEKNLVGAQIRLVDRYKGLVDYNDPRSLARTTKDSKVDWLELKNPNANPYDMPIPDGKGGMKPSINERIEKGSFAQTNPADVLDFVDITRLDVSRRKEAVPTVYQFIYDEVSKPDSTEFVKVNDLYPYGVVFDENNGNGDPILQGEAPTGDTDTIAQKIYAAGFTWSLAFSLWNKTWDMQRLNDGVATGYNAKRDYLALNPIISATYAGAQQTTASTVGTLRQELLYNTLVDALDDLGDREDPVTGRKIDVNGSVILASPYDARHIVDVINGQLSGQPKDSDSKYYRGLREIDRVIAYDGETIDVGLKQYSYSGVSNGTCYLIKPNKYFSICTMRGLTQEIDSNPDVFTLARERHAWYFVQAEYYAKGVANFVQEITLPTW